MPTEETRCSYTLKVLEKWLIFKVKINMILKREYKCYAFIPTEHNNKTITEKWIGPVLDFFQNKHYKKIINGCIPSYLFISKKFNRF